MDTTTAAPTTEALRIERAPERRIKFGVVPSLINPAWTAGLTGDVEGWYAEVGIAGGTAFAVSRLDGETDWTVDAAYTSVGLPIFANGFGARYLRTRVLVGDIVAELDEAVAPATGPASAGLLDDPAALAADAREAVR